jgi:hypothetical protein
LYLPTLQQPAATATIVTAIIYCYRQQQVATDVLTATSSNLHPEKNLHLFQVLPLQSKYEMVKMFLNRPRANPTVLNRDEEEITFSSSRSSLVSDTTEQLPFKILDKTSKFLENLT